MKRRRGFRLVIAVAGSLAVLTGGCGGSAKQGGAAARGTASDVRTVNGRIEGLSAPASGPHAFSDYDSDEYAAPARGGDTDNDDNAGRKDGDNDFDNSTGSYFDGDDRSELRFGRPASIGERRAIVGPLKRYYALGADQDGNGACALMASPIAKSVPETVGGTGGPFYFKGRTCGEVMTKIFAKNRHQFAVYAGSLRPVTVGVRGDEALVVFAVRKLPGREIKMLREHGAWRVYGTVDRELP